MSSPNKTKVLVGFGVVAIVLVAAIAFWPPTFRSEEASGAIGAVQKHHAPQIAQKDVILGDENTRNKQAVAYGDYFADAAKLQSISAQLASATASKASIDVAKNIQELQNEMQNQFASKMGIALSSIELQAKTANNTEMAANAEALASQLKASKELSAAEMQQFAAKFSNIAEMASKASNNVPLAQADKELASAIAEMANNTEMASKHLGSVETALAHSAELNNADMASFAEYLSNIAAASKVAFNVEQMASQEMGSKIKAAEALANEADQLAHKAFFNIDAQLASNTEMASALLNMDAQLAAAKQSGSKFGAELASIQQALAASRETFAARAGSQIEAQLASMGEYAASKQQYSKMGEAQLASALANSDLASKQLYGKLANNTECASHLQSMQEALANKQLGAVLANESQLAAQTAELQNQLASKQQY